jgi:hypothetical protein
MKHIKIERILGEIFYMRENNCLENVRKISFDKEVES